MTEQILTRDCVLTDVDINGSTKNDALKKIAELLSVEMNLNKRHLEKGLLKREKEGTTGFTDGLAIPHANIKELDDPRVGIVTFKNPIEWESLDGSGVKVAFVLLTPGKSKDNTHLKLLSELSRNLMKPEFVEKIQKNLSNADQLFEIVGKIINK